MDIEYPPCRHCGTQATPVGREALYDCRACGTRTVLGVTAHAVDRWTERTCSTISPPAHTVRWDKPGEALAINFQVQRAWSQSIPLVPNSTRLANDELRFHWPTETVLLRKDIDIVTVIDVPTAKNHVQRGVVQGCIAHRWDASVLTTLCHRYNITTAEFSTLINAEKRRQYDGAGQGEGGASGAVAPGRNPHSVASGETDMQS